MILDLLYLIGSIAFFTLMTAYVAACERLGEKSEEPSDTSEARK